MHGKRLIALSVLIGALVLVASAARAEEPPAPSGQPTGEPQAPSPNVEAARKDQPKSGSFWDKFHLYVAAAYGTGSGAKDITPSVRTSVIFTSSSTLSIEDTNYASVAIGWQLPAEQGSFIGRYQGHMENSYSFVSGGYYSAAVPPGGGTPTIGNYPIRWWTLNMRDGLLFSALTTPTWRARDGDQYNDDVNGDGVPQPWEVHYGQMPGTDFSNMRTVPSNLNNRVETYDGFYQRGFGGRKVNALWTAGLRFYTYSGNVPATVWLNGDIAGFGFTDGVGFKTLTFAQDASGWGPLGSMECRGHILRNRLTFYGQATVAFVLQSVSLDSGNFYSLVRDKETPSMVPVSHHLSQTWDKSSWQVKGEIGMRVQIVRGFFGEIAYSQTSYQDCILLPTQTSLPTTVGQISQGVAAVYKTQDLLLQTMHLGFSYQF
jgi:hypothetical protein